MTLVTAAREPGDYRPLIGSQLIRGGKEMTKFYSLLAATALFMPFALSMMNQAAQITA
jgi:hypothetical protein